MQRFFLGAFLAVATIGGAAPARAALGLFSGGPRSVLGFKPVPAKTAATLYLRLREGLGHAVGDPFLQARMVLVLNTATYYGISPLFFAPLAEAQAALGERASFPKVFASAVEGLMRRSRRAALEAQVAADEKDVKRLDRALRELREVDALFAAYLDNPQRDFVAQALRSAEAGRRALAEERGERMVDSARGTARLFLGPAPLLPEGSLRERDWRKVDALRGRLQDRHMLGSPKAYAKRLERLRVLAEKASSEPAYRLAMDMAVGHADAAGRNGKASAEAGGRFEENLALLHGFLRKLAGPSANAFAHAHAAALLRWSAEQAPHWRVLARASREAYARSAAASAGFFESSARKLAALDDADPLKRRVLGPSPYRTAWEKARGPLTEVLMLSALLGLPTLAAGFFFLSALWGLASGFRTFGGGVRLGLAASASILLLALPISAGLFFSAAFPFPYLARLASALWALGAGYTGVTRFPWCDFREFSRFWVFSYAWAAAGVALVWGLGLLF